MRVLIIGLSSIAQRRVIPALGTLPAVTAIDVASRGKDAPTNWPKRGVFFRDYAEALARSDAEVVYISLPNSDHMAWITAALEAGKHVVVDKPATLTLETAQAACALAQARGLLLAEATVFSYHAQFAPLRDFFGAYGPLTHIFAQFVIPALPRENFRNYRKLGGGCLTDMGPYAAATGRLFTDALPQTLHAVGAPPSDSLDIDMGFSFVARYGDGVQYVGQFSFESEYQNRLVLVGKTGSITVERVFSPPPDQDLVWQVRRNNAAGEERHPASDGFACFLDLVVAAARTGAHDGFRHDLLMDAQFRDLIYSSLSQDSTP